MSALNLFFVADWVFVLFLALGAVRGNFSPVNDAMVGSASLSTGGGTLDEGQDVWSAGC